MDLLEYQAKTLFQEVGIPVLPSQRINDPTEVKNLQIPYPIVLKSQVSVGSRGKAGGIRFVTNTIDAITAARIIFNLPILGEYPEVILAEAKYNATKELYLAVIVDHIASRPVLVGSVQGGMNIGALRQHIQQVVVYDEFSPFYARRLTLKMGLEGKMMLAVSQIVEKMYQLLVSKDLDTVEINPLGVNIHGDLMALDGKITVNDHAISRHPDLLKLQQHIRQKPTSLLSNGSGNIGLICSGIGLALASMDGIYQGHGKVSRCIVIDQNNIEQLQQAIDQMLLTNVKVLLINILGGNSQQLRAVINKYCTDSSMEVIVRIIDHQQDESQIHKSISYITSFDRAIAQTIALSLDQLL